MEERVSADSQSAYQALNDPAINLWKMFRMSLSGRIGKDNGN